jgi:hypothetical protein
MALVPGEDRDVLDHLKPVMVANQLPPSAARSPPMGPQDYFGGRVRQAACHLDMQHVSMASFVS